VKQIYNREYLNEHGIDSYSPERMIEQVRSNCEWFDHYAKDLPNRDFLDIGCCEGSSLRVMAALGWAVHGFDVVEPSYYGPHVTVGPHFTKWLFPNRYAAVMAREVIEHVDSPLLFLHECHGVLCPGGLLQVQTPKPCDWFHGAVYQTAHLTIMHPQALRSLINDAMFDILDFREWGEPGEQPGQAYLCKART
jgi:2-polyprenyl-3-methyl-5-hydroxy-6-metoxy-1,4-benzoquinol methylase